MLKLNVLMKNLSYPNIVVTSGSLAAIEGGDFFAINGTLDVTLLLRISLHSAEDFLLLKNKTFHLIDKRHFPIHESSWYLSIEICLLL